MEQPISMRARFILPLAASGVYVAAFLLVYRLTGTSVAALVIAPISLTAWFWGWRGGLISGLLAIPLNLLLLYLVDPANLMIGWGLTYNLSLSIVAMLLGIVLGQVREQNARLQQQIIDLQQIEKALWASEERYRLITDNLNDAVWTMDLAYQLTFINPVSLRARGYTRAELQTLPLEQQLAPASLDLFNQRVRQALTPDQLAQPDWHFSLTLELEFCRKDGLPYWSEVQISLLRAADGQAVGLLCIGRDITEQRRLETERERNMRQLAALSQMGQTVLASLALEAVLKNLVDAIPPLLQAEGVSILLLEEDEFVFAAVSGASSPDLRGLRMPASAGVAGEVLQTGRSVRISEEPTGQEKIYRDIERVSRYHSRSLLAAPIALRGQVIGVMEAVHTQPNAFSSENLQMLEAAAAWAAIAIANARQHEALQKQWQQSETIAALGRALNETLDLQRIFQLIVDSARRMMPLAERAVIHLLDEEKQVLLAVAVSGGTRQAPPEANMRAGEGIAGQVIAEGKLINSGDVRNDPRYVWLGNPNAPRSLMVAPVRSGARRLGTISVQSSVPDAFSIPEEQLLLALSVHAALAINNARLFEELRKRLDELTVLHTVSAAGAEATSEPALIERVTTIIGETLQAENYGVLLVEQSTGVLHAHPSYQAQLAAETPLVVPVGAGVIGQVALTGQPHRVTNITPLPEYVDLEPLTHTQLCVPIKVGERVLGVINVESSKRGAFTEANERLLNTLAGQLATAIEKVRLYNDLAQALRQEKSARARLVQNEKLAAMGRLVASVAHELNNPLQAIQNALYLVKQEPRLNAQAREDLQVALSEADRMAGLISRLRETYRPTTAEQFGLEDLNSLIEEVAKLTATHMRHGGVTFAFHADPNLPLVPGIRDQLKQVALNLVLNAVEAMPQGGHLTLQTHYLPDTRQVFLSFSDTGQGISPADLPNIFDPFFTTKDGGTGLGLAITYDIIQHHNGRIEAESTPGRGSTFRLWLPVDKE